MCLSVLPSFLSHAMSGFISSFLSGLTEGGPHYRGLFLAATSVLSYFALQKKSKNKYSNKLPPLPKKSTYGVNDIELDTVEFVALLKRIMEHCSKLQNAAPKVIPQEELVADIVIDYLKPYSTEQGGPLKVRKITYVSGRSNVIVQYAGVEDRWVSFVGSHMDVVPANPEEWKRNPFELTVEGDVLHGRGVTDCLGHVAMLTIFFKQLAILRPKLRVGVSAVFIANEENSSILGVGIDELQKQGEIDYLKKGPLFWVDSANIGPTLGTGGIMTWELTATGKGFHSGFPNRGINALCLAHEGLKYIQNRFYSDFKHSDEYKDYLYEIGSSLKPTQVEMVEGGITQIPRQCKLRGDCRFTPFFTPEDIKNKVAEYVKDLNEKVIRTGRLPTVGYDSFVLPEGHPGAPQGSSLQGLIEFNWTGHATKGVAVDMNSTGFKAICDAINETTGNFKPFALTGSLPIIADLKASGYDVQIVGFGRMDAYHAANEYAHISEFAQGVKIVGHVIENLNQHLK